VSFVWQAVRTLDDRPSPAMKPKLDRRRGYGDNGIASPHQPADKK
jgi:hypothetical protein